MTCKLETAGDFPSPSFWLAAFLDCTDSSKQRARNKTIVRLSQRNIWWWWGGMLSGPVAPHPPWLTPPHKSGFSYPPCF